MNNMTREPSAAKAEATDRVAYIAGVCDALGASWSRDAFAGTGAHADGVRAVTEGHVEDVPGALAQVYPDGDLAVHPFGNAADPEDIAAVGAAIGRPILPVRAAYNALIRSQIRRHMIRQGVAMDLVYPPEG